MKPHIYLFVLVASFFLPLSTSGMSILDFGKMDLDDESSFIALQVDGAAKLLRHRGQPVEAQKAIDLFKNSSRAGGLSQFAANLKALYAQNHINATNPNNKARTYEVEDALQMTLRDNGVNVSTADLLTITKEFAPANPPRQNAP